MDTTPNRRLPLPAYDHSAAIDASRIAEAIRLIDNDLVEALSPADFERIGRVLLGTVQHIKDGDLNRVPTAEAVRSYVADELSDLVGSSPAALDTLSELASALGNDPNFATSVINQLSTKASLAAMGSDYADKDKVLTNLGGGSAGKNLFKTADTTQIWNQVGPAGKADQTTVNAGTDDLKFITAKTLAAAKAWTAVQKITLTTATAAIDIPIPATGSTLRLSVGAVLPTTSAGAQNMIAFRSSINGGISYISGSADYFLSYGVLSNAVQSVGTLSSSLGLLGGRADTASVKQVAETVFFIPASSTALSYISAGYGFTSDQSILQSNYRGHAATGGIRPTHIRLLKSDGSNFGIGTTVILEIA